MLASHAMEDLIQQECLIESQLETYRSQLSLVEQQLGAGAGADTADLEQLKGDLSELISLTEDNLLEVKKQKLLLALQGFASNDSIPQGAVGSGGVPMDSTAPGSGQSDQYAEEGERGEGDEKEEEEEEDDLQGMKCQAPLKEAWGAVNYHNAVIVGREPDTDISASNSSHAENDFKVRVLFTRPMYNGMKPCSFFMEGKCKFDDHTCKFSHGHVVSFAELQAYQEPDFTLVHVGSKCLAKYLDGLWHPAIISSYGEVFIVHFTTLNSTTQLEPDSIHPIESSDDSSSSDSEESSEKEEEEEEEEGEGRRVQEWVPRGPQQALGEWEKHTTGIGSKLMAKMGYVVGQGLGKHGQGCVNPVEIEILPAGKSLDVCVEMREAKKLRKLKGQVASKRKKRKRKLAKALDNRQQQAEKSDLFDFLNKKIFKKDHRVPDMAFTLQKPTKPNDSSKQDHENLNVKLFKLHEEIKSVKKRRKSLQESLLRHKGRNKAMEAHVQEKLETAERQLTQLQRHEQTVQKDISSKTERRKLSVF